MQKLEAELLNGVVMDYTYDRVSTDPMRD
jgi:hypothetical protein